MGMGLGLFLARRVIERLGGTLTLESSLGDGTSVEINLPLQKAVAIDQMVRQKGITPLT